MHARVAVPIALLLLGAGLWGYSNGDIVNNWVQGVVPNAEAGADIIPMQENENWLVVVVDFDEHPAAPGLDSVQAGRLLQGNHGAAAYLDQLSGGRVTLNLTIFEDEIRAEHPYSYYGADSTDGARDIGESGSNGPSDLAEQVIKDMRDLVDWSQWDLNSDGVVDRLLILHTSRPQEDGGGNSRIWSHFGPMMNPVDVGGGMTVEHYTMASLRSTNYRGTIYHEMLHQHGAMDLYSVHDELRPDLWNGVGNWDVMASGNWNGNGAIPGLPMAATIQLLGVDNQVALDPSWPAPSPCNNWSIGFTPQNQEGVPLKITLSEGEYLWVEHRAKSGFDAQLPGEGLLVSIQNTNVKGIESNEVNSDSRNPWLMVIEADGDDGLIRGDDDGTAGDLFQAGDTFGSSGIEVRDRFGTLVTWTAEVIESVGEYTLNISSQTCGHSFTSTFPQEELLLLPGQSTALKWTTETDCQPSVSLISTDARPFGPVSQPGILAAGETMEMDMAWTGVSNDGEKGHIRGTLSCGDGPSMDIDVAWYTVGNIPTTTTYTADIVITEPSIISIPLGLEGVGQRTYMVEIEGALDRIITDMDTVSIGPGDELQLEVQPSDLMIPGMIARGEVILSDSNGNLHTIEVVLTGEPVEGSGDIIRVLRDPGTMALILCSLVACWVLLGIQRNPPPEPIPNPHHNIPVQSTGFYGVGGPPAPISESIHQDYPAEFN